MKGEKMELREIMVEKLIDAVNQNKNIVVLVSDSTSTSRIKLFQQKFPDRLINVGIAEQNMVGVAAGISMGGQIAVTANAAPFLLNRSNEQIKNDICYARTNVKLIGLNPGLCYGSLGPTHHSIDDISIMRGFGNILIFTPSDPIETEQILNFALDYEGPVYIRLDSASLRNIHDDSYKFRPGKPIRLLEGSDITILALGTAVHDVVQAAELLKNELITPEVISISSIRPFENDMIINSINKTGQVVTVEEHSTHGGLGSLTADLIAEKGLAARLLKLGIPEGSFAEACPRDYLKKKYRIDASGITEVCIKLLKGMQLYE